MNSITEKYVKKIKDSSVYDVAIKTPLQHVPLLSKRLANRVYLKREDLQPVHSFKIRGAYNKMSKMTEANRSRGVIAASAGNHAQGVAYSAKALGVKATIVMGENTPSIKVDAVTALGAKVILHGDTYDQAAIFARDVARENDYVFVHPYDDANVIAGQGTIGMEILEQLATEPDIIFVPVGGGGLIAGVSAYSKAYAPKTKIIGVEAEGSACLSAAMQARRRVRIPFEELDLFADGVSVSQVGREPFRVVKDLVDEVVCVTIDEICAAIKDVYDDTRCIAEPAGALAIAGMKKYVATTKTNGKSLVGLVTGANVNFDRLRHISERAELGEQREVILGVTIPEKAGSFLAFSRQLGKRAVSEFNYRFSPGEQARVYVGAQVTSYQDRENLISSLLNANYVVEDMSNNEVAKLHVRHMVGGRTGGVKKELVYRFEFPERPGALLKFLGGIGKKWNITMFHYRNHGAAWARVLVSFEADETEKPQLSTYLEKIGYRHWEETDNQAYKLFLE